ncbi:hypothetical protein ABZ470_39725 [Streptosporangium sp. NPDC020072]|uniref:hypothetical protein n=1 Tax=Streptosporangium sp. NPDC020072 TaxID=3154788 RepID=UPI0034308F95
MIEYTEGTIAPRLITQQAMWLPGRGYVKSYGVHLEFDDLAWNPQQPDRPYVGPGYVLYEKEERAEKVLVTWLPSVLRYPDHQFRVARALSEAGLTPILQQIGPNLIDQHGAWSPARCTIMLDDKLAALLAAAGVSYRMPGLRSGDVIPAATEMTTQARSLVNTDDLDGLAPIVQRLQAEGTVPFRWENTGGHIMVVEVPLQDPSRIWITEGDLDGHWRIVRYDGEGALGGEEGRTLAEQASTEEAIAILHTQLAPPA